MTHVRKREGKKGNSYQVRYRNPEGGEKVKTFKRRRDADRFVTKIDHDLLVGGYGDPVAGRHLIVDRQNITARGVGYLKPTPKSSASNRTVPVPDLVLDAIRSQIRDFPADDGFVFSNARERR